MNAYELAEKAEGLAYEIPADWSSGEPKNVATDIAAMLRQQADRIAELEETIGACYAVQKMQAEEVYKGNDRIAELEKQGEPVAWMEYIQDEEWEVWYTEPTDLPEGHSYKPLYLAPQRKPLSDEEIIKIFNQIWNAGGNTNGVMHRFARAIEERHGIK